MAREGIFSDSKFLEIAELTGAAAPGPHHFARILDRGLKAGTCPQWLEGTSPQTQNVKNR